VWVMTTRGMFSVVAYDEGRTAAAPPLPAGLQSSDALLVRARTEDDLVAMLSAIQLPGSRALSTPSADYPWRAVIGRGEWARFLSLEVERLDYPNFKAKVLEVQGRERHDVYTRVWSTLRSLGREGQDGGPEPALW
jgi:hypothetical protein